MPDHMVSGVQLPSIPGVYLKRLHAFQLNTLKEYFVTSTSPFSLKPVCLAILLSAACSAQAEITIYTDQAAFLAAVSAPGVDSYNDLSYQAYPDTLYREAGAYRYQAYSESGLFGTGTPSDGWLSNNHTRAPIVFSNFSGGVNAFGGNFFASDIMGDYLPGGSVVLTAIDGSALTYTVIGATTDSFLGFISSTPLTSVVLNSAEEYWPTANNVVLAVPEPTSYGMLLAGCGVLGLFARRRR